MLPDSTSTQFQPEVHNYMKGIKKMQTKSKESNKTTCEVVIWSMTQEEKGLREV